MIEKTIVFRADRKPNPSFVHIGFETDNMVERLVFVLPSIHVQQTATLMIDGKYVNMAMLAEESGRYYIDLTAELVGAPGQIDAYITIDAPDGKVWNSAPFALVTGDLPDVDGAIQEHFPDTIQQMRQEIAGHRAEMQDQSKAVQEAADRVEKAAGNISDALDGGIDGQFLGNVNGEPTWMSLGDGSGGSGIAKETDPTVPAWAKQPEKPTYTAEEVGAQPKGDYASREDVERLSEEIEQLKNGPVDLTEATKSGEIATVTPVAGTTAKAVSKITGQDATWQHANILQLRHLTGKNLFDFTQFFGGVGKAYSQDGLTATINDNGTVTIKGTNTSSGWVNIVQTRTSGENAHFRWIFPAGTYTVPSEITVQLVKVNGGWTSLGNKKGTFTVGEPFWLSGAYIAYASGAAVDSTIPLVMVSGSALPSSGYSFSGEVYTANFTSPITDGEFNWQTGELKDADGSLIETIEPFEEFPVFDGANTFMTGVGVSTVTYKVPDDGSGVSGVEAFDPEVWGLPVLYLNGNVTGMSKDNAVTMNYVYGTQEGTCTVKWQGSTSLSFPKKNYTIKFDTAFEAVDGWGEQKKYCAKANWIDHSHARNVVNAKLWGQIVKSRKTVPTVLANLVNGGAVDGFPMLIVINKEFKGLYTFNIPKDGWMFGMGSGTNEAIICADKWVPATYYKEEAAVDGSDFELEYVTDENNAGWVTTSINRLINACMASDGSDLDTTIAQYLDWDSAIDYLIFTVMVVGYDMTGKNYINATFDGTKWFFSAYDMDCTYCLNATGDKFLQANQQPSFAQYAANHKVMELIVNHKKDALKARYAELRETVLSESNIATEFANFAGLIPSPVLMQDVKLWPGIPNTSVNNISQVRDAYRLRCMLADKWIEEL